MPSTLRAAGLALLAVVAVSCGTVDSPSGPTPTPSPSPVPLASPSPSPAPPASAPAPAPYVYSGTVTDGVGRPVVGATVRGGPDSGVTDANGRYEFRSSNSPPVPGNVYPPAGYERKPVYYYESFPLAPEQNITIRRITSVSISPPATLKVGGHESMGPRISFDTGQVESPVFDYFERSVSDPTVLKFLAVFGALVEGVNPGTASVTGSYFGMSADTKQIQVVP